MDRLCPRWHRLQSAPQRLEAADAIVASGQPAALHPSHGAFHPRSLARRRRGAYAGCMNPRASARGRFFYVDRLRIGAFALLVLYHVGMVYVTWDFHVKHPPPTPHRSR